MSDVQLEETMRKFEQFDKDRSGYIEQHELDGLKKLFTLKKLDIGVVDGKVSRAEFVAAVHKVPYAVAKNLVGVHMDKLALAARLQAEVNVAMDKFNSFDKVRYGLKSARSRDDHSPRLCLRRPYPHSLVA